MTGKSKRKIAEKMLGRKHTEETKEKISSGVKRHHECGAPIEVLMETDLEKCGKFWKSKYINITIPNPNVGGAAYSMRYHVAIMEKHIGRKLRPGEAVHHWFGREINKLKYLKLAESKAEHMRLDEIVKNVKRTLFKHRRRLENAIRRREEGSD